MKTHSETSENGEITTIRISAEQNVTTSLREVILELKIIRLEVAKLNALHTVIVLTMLLLFAWQIIS